MDSDIVVWRTKVSAEGADNRTAPEFFDFDQTRITL
jgi:hypothetical protein